MNMMEIIMAHVNLFDKADELQKWAEEMGLLAFPELQQRIEDMRLLENTEDVDTQTFNDMLESDRHSIMETANKFDKSDELEQWAVDMRILKYPGIQERINDLRTLEEEDMDTDDYEAVIESHLNSLETEKEVIDWSSENHLNHHHLVKKRVLDLQKKFQCDTCNTSFKFKSSLKRHVQCAHKNLLFSCRKCDKKFTYNTNRVRHEKMCTGKRIILRTFECRVRKAIFNSAAGLASHSRFHLREGSSSHFEPRQGSSTAQETQGTQPEQVVSEKMTNTTETSDARRYKCRTCGKSFQNRKELYIHHMNHKQEGDGLKLQDEPWLEGEAPWKEHDTVNEKLKEVYQANYPLILEENTDGTVVSRINVPITNSFSNQDLIDKVNELVNEEDCAFRINFSFGLILQNSETGEYRYFRPFHNETLLDQPLLISKRQDVNKKLRLRLTDTDLFEYMLRQRENSKWRPVCLTNVHFIIYRTNFTMGTGKTPLPNYITKKRSICSLTHNSHGKSYNDNLCAFRCLSKHFQQANMEKSVIVYFKQWVKYLKDENIGDLTCINANSFTGILWNQLSDFEKCFQININVFSLDENEVAHPRYVSRDRFNDSMNLNLFENHLSYITNIRSYCSKFECIHCEKMFTTSYACIRHRRSCDEKTTFHFPGGFHKLFDTIFDALEEMDFIVSPDEKVFPWFIVYDFEAMLKPVTVNRNTDKLKWTNVHVPISVSVCSNVADFAEPNCFVNSDLNILVQDMVQYMNTISDTAFELAKEKWSEIIQSVSSKIATEENKLMLNIYKQLESKMKTYCQQIPVLGFNSAKYDINLVKQKLAKELQLNVKEQNAFVVKKNNAYSCISNTKLKFLDISNYLAPGSSYSKFLAAYKVPEQKGYFPYQWFDSEAKLHHPSLPSHSAFYNTLKNKNITEEEYKFCTTVWRDLKMTTFRDFLIWYNNLDVHPFVTAVKEFQKFYFEKGIDVFKISMSVPGIARRLLFEVGAESGATFSLFHKDDKDLYQAVQNNLIGGPSIIFKRYAKSNETCIRNNPEKLCKPVVGYDANALYLWAIGRKMPIGAYIRREKETNFRPQKREKYMMAFYWLDWISQQQNIKIIHKMNNKNEKRIGPFPVDGYSPETRTVYQFHGCYFHGHTCSLTKNIQDETLKEKQREKYEKTKETTAYLKKRGYNVIEIWECEFMRLKTENPGLQNFIFSHQPSFYRKYPREVTSENILKSVRSEDLFGMVEVDIEVPDVWSEEFRHNSTSPYEYFSEMSPLFCTTEVPFDIIGDHMQQHVKKFDLTQHPRRLLVGGMKGERMLLATPLLKWYLDHGLKVTAIHQVIEYNAAACFRRFVEDVSNARRQGDLDTAMRIIAETFKLIGNSGYGGLIMDKSKHRTIAYVSGETNACAVVNNSSFRNLTCLDAETEFYEVELAKKTISHDLPIQLGFFILQYAKLKMLMFYYDFMSKYVERSDFEYLQMDTDSAYFSLSSPSLSDVIKPNMKNQYSRDINEKCTDADLDTNILWFPRTCCTNHARYDLREPGLMKLEYKAEEYVGLCSKTYILRNQNELKSSSKGLSKSSLSNAFEQYKSVLETQKSESGINKGFRARDNTIFTYEQERSGLSYFYCKRRVLDDGINTVPLNLVLRPYEKFKTVKTTQCLDDGGQSEILDEYDKGLVGILMELMDEES